jgi:FkbM family methyltransferase
MCRHMCPVRGSCYCSIPTGSGLQVLQAHLADWPYMIDPSIQSEGLRSATEPCFPVAFKFGRVKLRGMFVAGMGQETAVSLLGTCVNFARLKSIVRRWLRPPLHKPEVDHPYQFLGTGYGGWPLLENITPAKPLIYSIGVGEDASFDLAAIANFQARVHAFDPTPRSLNWVKGQTFPTDYVFHAIGIADHDGDAVFHAPANAGHVSFSVAPGTAGGQSVSAPVRRFATLVRDLGTGLPDVLKMDIEGFEYSVLPDILKSAALPVQLLIEYHQGMYGFSNADTVASVNMLREAGYVVFYVSPAGREYGFVLKRALA